MKNYVPRLRSHEELHSIKCDLCGETYAPGDFDGWYCEGFQRAESKLSLSCGEIWPDGSNDMMTLEADICPACFIGAVIPALRNIGVQFWVTGNGHTGAGRSVSPDESLEGWFMETTDAMCKDVDPITLNQDEQLVTDGLYARVCAVRRVNTLTHLIGQPEKDAATLDKMTLQELYALSRELEAAYDVRYPVQAPTVAAPKGAQP